jgi:sulfur-carrier protein adenylyltransferase/sulfurtransferase
VSAERPPLQISALAAYQQQQLGARLIDIREVGETAIAHAAHAELIPRAQLQKHLQDAQTPANAALLLICASGQRSSAASEHLRQLGFAAVQSVQGGLAAWRQADLPVYQPALDFDPERYARQIILPGFGAAGQSALARAKVLIVGAGGLGSPASLYLAAAGIGTLGIADSDSVDVSNLQRQILHQQDTIGWPKTRSAEQRLQALNPACRLQLLERITPENVASTLAEFDVIVDGSDNFATRFLLADVCVALKKPLIYGAVLRYSGQVSVFAGHEPNQPCYRCLFSAPPASELAPNCAEAGVLGVLPGLIGVLQATEVIKWISGIGQPLLGRLLIVEMLSMRFREITLSKDPACINCGPNPDPARALHYVEAAHCQTSIES